MKTWSLAIVFLLSAVVAWGNDTNVITHSSVEASATLRTNSQNSTKSEQKPPMVDAQRAFVSKQFHLDPKKFAARLSLAADAKPSTAQVGELTFLKSGNKSVERHQQIRMWLKGLGVDISIPGKSVFYNDTKGLLLIRASRDDLHTVQTALETLLFSETHSG